MARYKGAVCRLCRREGMKLFLKGAKCFTDKCPVEKRNFAPGQHGKDRKAKVVGYGLQLREKQKTKRMYFTLETQFRNYFEKAARKPGVTGELVPPGKPEALGDAIAGVLRHAERRREMGLQGRKRFVSQFSADVNIPKIESILAEAAGRA